MLYFHIVNNSLFYTTVSWESTIYTTKYTVALLCCILLWSFIRTMQGSLDLISYISLCGKLHRYAALLTWTHFPHWWTFLWEILMSPMDSPKHKISNKWALMFYFIIDRTSWTHHQIAIDLRYSCVVTVMSVKHTKYHKHIHEHPTTHSFGQIKWSVIILDTIGRVRDDFVFAPSQWETMLQCNVVSHWLGACTISSLHVITGLQHTLSPYHHLMVSKVIGRRKF